MNIKHVPKFIYANIALMVYVIAASIGGIVSRHIDSSWDRMLDVRLKYDLLFGVGFIVFSIVVIIGLVLKKEWGRQWANAFNTILLFSFVGIRLFSYLYFKIVYNEGSIPIDIDAVVISAWSLFMLYGLSTKRTKEYFKNHTQQQVQHRIS